MQSQPMGQGTFAEIVLKQEGLVRVKLLQRGDNLVQLGVNLGPANLMKRGDFASTTISAD
jgi:hypothetical protein